MKKTLLLTFLLNSLVVIAQKNISYYNWQWKLCDIKQARFVSYLQHSDSGWYRMDYFIGTNKLQMAGLYSDSTCKNPNGSFYWFYPNNNLSSRGKYINGKKQGLWLNYLYNGTLGDSAVYDAGVLTGTQLAWYGNGYFQDSTVNNNDGTGVSVWWFDDGTLSAAGRLLNQKKNGRWKFFHKNSNIAAMEEYHLDTLINRIYYNEDGTALTDTTCTDKEATFIGGAEKWRKYLEHNLQFPSNYNIINAELVTIVIKACVNEDGTVTDAYVDIPFHPDFDAEALRVIKKSPKWLPAIKNNRRVKMNIRQPVSFGQY
jgi:Gram-negative bacterial TonB protein C-terminal